MLKFRHFFFSFSALAFVVAVAAQADLFDEGLVEGRCDPSDPICIGDSASSEPRECENEIQAVWDFQREVGPGADAVVVNRSARVERRFSALVQAANVELALSREQRLFSLMNQGYLGSVRQRGGPWIKVLTVSRLDQDANHIDFRGLPFEGDIIPFLGPCMKQQTSDHEQVKHECKLVEGSTSQAVCKVWKDGHIVATEAFVKTSRSALRRLRRARR